jgi:chaperonin cofactor prefoldin
MSPSPLTIDAPRLNVSSNSEFDRFEHEQQVAKLTKALYPVDKQEKFLELQAEVETLFVQLQALQRVRV